MTGDGQIIIEFHPIGAYVKVSAIDARSLVEVSIVGAADAGREALERTALRKLEYVLRRRAKAAPTRRGGRA